MYLENDRPHAIFKREIPHLSVNISHEKGIIPIPHNYYLNTLRLHFKQMGHRSALNKKKKTLECTYLIKKVPTH